MASPDMVLQQLKKGQYAPVYFLHGDETFYIDQISEYIEEHALPESSKSFNQIILYGKDTNISDVLNQARRFPMMSERQVVMVKECQELPDWPKEDSLRLMEAYLSQPLDTTVLVLQYKHKLLAKNTKWYKLLQKGSEIVESKKIYDSQVPDWIRKYLKSRKRQADETAVQLLAEAIGANLGRLHTELEKILINLGPEESISPAIIEKYVGISKEYNIFELINALAYHRVDKAQKILAYWQANPKKQPLIPSLTSLFNFFVKLLLAYQEKDRSDHNLASVLKVNPYFVKEYKAGMQHYPMRNLSMAIRIIREADLRVKGLQAGPSHESEIFREMVYKLLHLGRS